MDTRTSTRANGTASRPPRQKVTFEPNVTQLVTLEFNEPTPCSGLSGDQWQYFLADGKILWVSPDLKAAIDATGARAGDTVAITRRTVMQSGRRQVVWEAERCQDEPDFDDQPPQPFDHQPHSQPPRSAAPRQAQPEPPPPPAPATAPQIPPQPVSGDGTTRSVAYARCLFDAMEACQLAEEHGARIGRRIAFDSADVRAIAATLWIEQRDRR